jgi:hypothetical protein
MTDLLRRILDREFRDVSGLVVSGSIPLRESFINDLIGDTLRYLARERSSEPSVSGGSLNLAAFALLVKEAHVRIDSGSVTLEFELRA